MRILIATGIYPPQIGGPAYYAEELKSALEARRHHVAVATYDLERSMPSGMRHIFYLMKITPGVLRSDLVIALDTMSTGFPAVIAGRLCRRPTVVRIGGDFLWESHVERTQKKIPLSRFYKTKPKLNAKERIIRRCTGLALRNASALVFSTAWIRDIWTDAYRFAPEKATTIENFYGEKYGEKKEEEKPARKNFLWAGRPVFLKNTQALRSAFAAAQKKQSGLELTMEQFSRAELRERIKNCYAVILPSLSEVSPNFILDAIRFNKPFILTKDTGFYEKLKDTGVFVDPLDEKDIQEKIIMLADDENYIKYKKRVVSFNFFHSWDEIAGEFLSIYRQLWQP